MYAGRRQEIEDKMRAELAGYPLTKREDLIIQLCANVAARVVAEEVMRELGRTVSRAFRY